LKKASGSGKKRKKNIDIGTADTSIPALNDSEAKKLSGKQTPQPGSGSLTPSGGIKNAATASLTAKVLEEEKSKNKRRKLGANDNLKSLFSSENGVFKKNGDFMTRGYSIPAGAKP